MNQLKTAEQQITKAHVDIMRSPAFKLISGVLCCGDVRFSDGEDGIKTAATDGWNVFYNRSFILSLPPKQRNFIVLHENYHKMLKQLTTWNRLNKINRRVANMAADYVINLLIVEQSKDSGGNICEMPPIGLYDERFTGMNTKQVFDILMKEGKGNGKGEPLDGHDWEKAREWTDKEKAEIDRQLDIAIRQGQRLAGSGTGGLSKALGEVLEIPFDWRAALQEFICNTVKGDEYSSWGKPNRRHLHTGTYRPSGYSDAAGDLVVAIDTSGSVWCGDEIQEFASHLVKLCNTVRPTQLHLMWWDTAVAGYQVFTEGKYDGMMQSLRPEGGGGSDPTCVFEKIEKDGINADAIVVLTDGYINWPKQCKTPTLWAINNKDTKAPWGLTFNI